MASERNRDLWTSSPARDLGVAAIIVLANTCDSSYLPLLRRAAYDVNLLIRATTTHALLKLGDVAT